MTPHFSRRIPLALLAGLPLLAGQASAVTIINFGLTTGATPADGVTFNNVATTNVGSTFSVANLNNQSGNATGISIASTGGNWFAMGSGGSFSPIGAGSYTTGNSALIDGWISTYQASYGNLWQAGANGDNQTASISLGGLAANTTYQITLLSVRANGFLTDPGSYAFTYDGSSDGVTSALAGAGTLVGNTVSGSATGNSNGLNAREITWTFSTGEVPAGASLNLTGDWNVNAVIIDVIPEPSSLAFGATGLLALFRRSR